MERAARLALVDIERRSDTTISAQQANRSDAFPFADVFDQFLEREFRSEVAVADAEQRLLGCRGEILRDRSPTLFDFALERGALVPGCNPREAHGRNDEERDDECTEFQL